MIWILVSFLRKRLRSAREVMECRKSDANHIFDTPLLLLFGVPNDEIDR